LKSNGNIFLVNPAGVVIHNGARIETGGFTASTRDIGNDNFMKGNYVFDKPGHPDAKIINRGNITVRDSGLAALVAPTVRNEGIIAARLGKVALASGDSTYKLDMYGDDLISFTVAENDVNRLHATDGTPLGVENTGTIKAEGGVVLLSATQLDGIVGSVVNNGGTISAASSEAKGGKVIFKGEGATVDVVNTGTVTASSDKADGGVVRLVADGKVTVSGAVEAGGAQKGGQVDVSGKKETVIAGAKINADGKESGLVRLGGEFQGGKEKQIADADTKKNFVERHGMLDTLAETQKLTVDSASEISAGSDGTLVAWSGGSTSIEGILSGKFVETSGKNITISKTPFVSQNGILLLDPATVSIVQNGSDGTPVDNDGNVSSNVTNISSSWIQSYLASNGGNLIISATSVINVNYHLNYSNGSLILNASPGGNININANIVSNRALTLNANNVTIKDSVTISCGLIGISGTSITLGTGSQIVGSGDMRLGTENSIIKLGNSAAIKLNSSNEIALFGNYLELGQYASINGDSGRIVLWGSLDSNNVEGNGYDAVNKPFDTITLSRGAYMIAGHISIFTKQLKMTGNRIESMGSLHIAAGRTGRSDQYNSTGDENSYQHNAYSSVSIDNASQLIAKSAELYLQSLSISNNGKVIPIDVEFISLYGESGKTIKIAEGSVKVPTIKSVEISFEGSGASYELGERAILTNIFYYDDNIKQIKGLVFEFGDRDANIFGISKPNIYDDESWTHFLEQAAKFISETRFNTVKIEFLNEISVNLNDDKKAAYLHEIQKYSDIIIDINDKNITLITELYHAKTGGDIFVSATAYQFMNFLIRIGIYKVSQEEIVDFLETLDSSVLQSDDLLNLYLLAHFVNSEPIGPSLGTHTLVEGMDRITEELFDIFTQGAFSHSLIIDEINTIKSILNNEVFLAQHYERSDTMYRNAPATEQELLDSGTWGNSNDWQADDASHSVCHNMNGASGNMSYRYVGEDSQYKGYQYVFDEKGELVSPEKDTANMGSYDISDPKTSSTGHIMYDLVPWILFGNSPNDPTTANQRMNEALIGYIGENAKGYGEVISKQYIDFLIFLSNEVDQYSKKTLTRQGSKT
jgi:hypothetical protein